MRVFFLGGEGLRYTTSKLRVHDVADNLLQEVFLNQCTKQFSDNDVPHAP